MRCQVGLTFEVRTSLKESGDQSVSQLWISREANDALR